MPGEGRVRSWVYSRRWVDGMGRTVERALRGVCASGELN